VRNLYHRGETMMHEQCQMTSAEYAKISNDYKATRISEDGTHRVRTAMRAGCKVYAVFITDSKVHPIPVPAAPAPAPAPTLPHETDTEIRARADALRTRVVAEAQRKDAAAPFDAMKESLRAGVHVVSAPQLFPTPPALAARMAEMADIQPGDFVLEPSAGTGRLIDALPTVRPGGWVVAVEINHALARALEPKADETHCTDFLTWRTDDTFDVILMNPPFANGADIKHIEHARLYLKPGGRLVALCANGPRQQSSLKPIADTWEVLPAGSFESEGTGVNVALLTFVGY
jgi:phospholipid N-methyltransferase